MSRVCIINFYLAVNQFLFNSEKNIHHLNVHQMNMLIEKHFIINLNA